jgi:DNA-binding transcriptional LysR family regulator
VAPLDFAAPARRPLSLREISHERFIMREAGSGTRLSVDDLLRRRGVKLNVRLTLGSNEAIKHAVAGGLGLGIFSKHAIGMHPEEEGVKVLNVEGFPIEGQWYIVRLRNKPVSIVAREFIRHLGGLGDLKPAATRKSRNR